MAYRRTGWIIAVPLPALSALIMGLIAAMAFLVAAQRCAVAQGSGAPTVEWFATHTAEREQIIRRCRNDPAWARTDPYCINASDAQAEVIKREGEERVAMLPLSDPRYWRGVRVQRHKAHLRLCRTMAAEFRRLNFCDAAEKAVWQI